MVVTFLNVTISIEADDATEAYNKLCNTLSNAPNLEWTTDRFVTNDPEDHYDEQERSTTELMEA